MTSALPAAVASFPAHLTRSPGYHYLASPYTHHDPAVVEARYNAAVEAAGRLMRQGWTIFSPIAHSHVIAGRVNLPTTWDYWRVIDEAFLSRADSLMVLTLDGWTSSRGVRDEIAMAARHGVPVSYVRMEDLT